jgi:hypothetical protein
MDGRAGGGQAGIGYDSDDGRRPTATCSALLRAREPKRPSYRVAVVRILRMSLERVNLAAPIRRERRPRLEVLTDLAATYERGEGQPGE